MAQVILERSKIQFYSIRRVIFRIGGEKRKSKLVKVMYLHVISNVIKIKKKSILRFNIICN